MTSDTSTLAVVKTQTSVLETVAKWQVALPVVSAMLAILSFVFGGLYSAWSARQSQAEAQAAQWHGALQKVNFDESNLIASAFLLEDFSKTPYRDTARQLELAMLDRTSKVDTFDLIFYDIMVNITSPSELASMMDVDRTLVEHLRELYLTADRNAEDSKDTSAFESFLSNPTPYFSSTNDGRLTRSLALLWELDTFSGRIACALDQKSKQCYHPAPSEIDGDGVILVNHPVTFSQGAEKMTLRSITTCSVHRTVAQSELMCK